MTIHKDIRAMDREAVKGARVAVPAPGFTVEEHVGGDAHAIAIAGWSALSQEALVTNPTLAPSYHLPCLRHLGGDDPSLRIALVRRTAMDGEPGAPAAVISYHLPTGLSRLRHGPAGTWQPIWGFLGTPLLARQDGAAALAAFLRWFAARHGRAFLMRKVPSGGPFGAVLETLARQGFAQAQVATSTRAVYAADEDAATYMAHALKRDRRGRLGRQRRRLSEQGDLRVRRYRPGEDTGPWAERFMAIEATGWKGRAGTAIACGDDTRPLFLDVVARLEGENRLGFWAMELDGVAIAMMVGIVGPGTAWLLKMAYDESYSRFSPGTLLGLDIMDDFAADPEIEVIDSCADQNHPMWDHLWQDRLHLADIMIDCAGSGSVPERAAHMERRRLAARGALKRFYHALRRKLSR